MTLVTRGFQAKLYPNKEQAAYIDKCLSVGRFIYNFCLRLEHRLYERQCPEGYEKREQRRNERKHALIELKNMRRHRKGLGDRYSAALSCKVRRQRAEELAVIDALITSWLESLPTKYQNRSFASSYDLHSMITRLKCIPEYAWLREVPHQVLQAKASACVVAYKNFFSGHHSFPDFKSDRNDSSGIQYNNGCKIHQNPNNLCVGKVVIPTAGHKIKPYAITGRGLRPELIENGILKAITLKRIAGNYYASCRYSIEEAALKCNRMPDPIYESCGIDLGIVNPVTISWSADKAAIRGRKHAAVLKGKNRALKRSQRAFSRAELGSKSREHKKKAMQRRNRDVTCYRKDWIEKDTTHIVRENAIICVENLSLVNMTKAVKYKADGSDRKNVASKSSLNREMLNMSHGLRLQRLVDKASANGRTIVKVCARNTSRKCSACGYTHKLNRMNQADFMCRMCGYRKLADVNAAINIHERGKAIYLRSLLQ